VARKTDRPAIAGQPMMEADIDDAPRRRRHMLRPGVSYFVAEMGESVFSSPVFDGRNYDVDTCPSVPNGGIVDQAVTGHDPPFISRSSSGMALQTARSNGTKFITQAGLIGVAALSPSL